MGAGLNKLPAHTPLRALASESAARSLRFEDDYADTEWLRHLTPRNTRCLSGYCSRAALCPERCLRPCAARCILRWLRGACPSLLSRPRDAAQMEVPLGMHPRGRAAGHRRPGLPRVGRVGRHRGPDEPRVRRTRPAAVHQLHLPVQVRPPARRRRRQLRRLLRGALRGAACVGGPPRVPLL